jgi:hypothetical protein
MHLTVCFEASRLTLTQSSWTTPQPGCSRQWMSGYAAVALAAPSDRGPRANFNLTALGELVPLSEGESPFPLDFYLSWMSPVPPVPPGAGRDISRLSSKILKTNSTGSTFLIILHFLLK